MKILIKTLNGESFKIECELDWNMCAIKEQIAKLMTCEQNSIRLIFAGKQLEDESTISQLKITEDDHLIVIVLKVLLKRKSSA